MCCVNSSHRVTAFHSRILSLRLFLWKLQSDIWKPIEGYGEKGIIFS
ncbi:nef attachable domain protein [Chlamydia psittaci 02DC14]|nr:nef attachable domain protein [Chlamydia psittaci 02DC14]